MGAHPLITLELRPLVEYHGGGAAATLEPLVNTYMNTRP